MQRFAVVLMVLAAMAAASVRAGSEEMPVGFQRVWPAGPVTDLDCLAISDGGTVVAGGEGPVLVVSPDGGASWQRVALPEGVSGILALGWGGGRFVAVAADGRSLTSGDGVTWVVHEQDPPLDWVEDVAWTGDGFVAVGGTALDESGGKVGWAVVASSPDGEAWTEVDRVGLYYGAWPREIAVHGDVLVAVPFLNNNPYTYGVLASTDGGGSWEPIQLDFAPDHVAATADGFYVLDRAWTHQDGTVERPAARSTDGMTWTRLDAVSLGTDEVEALAWTGGRLIAVGEWGTAESTDGTSWRALGDPAEAPRPRFRRLGLLDGVGLVGVGREETVLRLAGSQWEVMTTSGWPDLARIAASPHRLVAVGSAWLPGMSPLMGSTDGLTWAPLAAPEGIRDVTDVVWTGERFVAAAAPSLLVSEDGSSWEERSPGDAVVRGLEAVPGGVLAVGEAAEWTEVPTGVVLWSPDGLSWQERARLGAGLVDVGCTPDGSACVAVGWSGLAAAGSPDGAWQETYLAPEDPGASLEAVATDGRRWVAAGSSGVFTSADGLAWERAQELGPSLARDVRARDVAWVGDGFLALHQPSTADPWPGTWAWRSLDGRWWGSAAHGETELDHVAVAGGTAWLLGEGGRIAAARPAPSPAAESPFAYLLPAAAHAPGLGGTLWRSDLFLSARDATRPATADLFLLTSEEAAASASRRRVAVGGDQTLAAEDLVGAGLGQAGVTGAVLIRADAPLTGWSRTFTERPDGGTYGQMIPLVPLGELEPVQDLIGLEEDGLFRTNLGLVNAGPAQVTARVEVRGTLGELLAASDVELGAFSFTLRTHVLRALGLAPIENAWIRVLFPFTQEHPHPPCLAFASVVDEGTGDPTLVLPQRAAGADQVVPVVVHLPGYNGTLWRTDLDVVNTGAAPARFRLEYWPAAAALPSVTSPPLELAPGAAARYRDVVASVLGTGDKGVLVVHALEGAVAVRSRTFTVAPQGSYGQAIPAVDPGAAAIQWGRWIGLPVETGEAPPFRVNLGLVNLAGESREVSLWGPDDPDLHDWILDPNTLLQLDHALRPLSGAWAPWVQVAFSSWDGPVLGYVSMVDNRTGDPLFLPAQERE